MSTDKKGACPCNSCKSKRKPEILPKEPEHGWSPYVDGQAYIQEKYRV